ncbi:MAG: tRNA pseudouridine(38-40) synthase TruA [Thermaurantiacus tibetensis]
MTRFRLTLEWDGRGFMGWQRQAHGPSVQKALETALHEVTGEAATFHAAGRTDAGVHALAMPAHVDVARAITPFRLMEALNARLRAQGALVAVLACEVAPPGFHARFSCIGRAYVYRLVMRRAPLTLEAGRAWRVPRSLDLDSMRAAAALLVGRHDFTTFRSVHCQASSPVRTLDRLDVVATDAERLEVRTAARSFLHHQVRSMVGALVLVGLGRWSVARVGEALAARNRSALGLNAPPDGLHFAGARYPDLSEDFTVAAAAFGTAR